MEKIIPALPCPDIKAQINFYKCLGFNLVRQHQYTEESIYVIMEYKDVELHFYASPKMIPSENGAICIFQVDDIDDIHEKFSLGLEHHFGEMPQTGIPRITNIKDLSEDRRFTLIDMGGNTFYVCTPNKEKNEPVFRRLSNENHAKDFATLYDLIYSKEDLDAASNLLPKLLMAKDSLDALDKAKLLLLALEIKAVPEMRNELKELIDQNRHSNHLWKKIEHRHYNI